MDNLNKLNKLIDVLPPELKLSFFTKLCNKQFTSAELFRFVLNCPEYASYVYFKDHEVLINDKGIRFETGSFAMDSITFSELSDIELRNLIDLLNNNLISFKDAEIDSFISDDISFIQVYPDFLLELGDPIQSNLISLYNKIGSFRMKHFDYGIDDILEIIEDPEFLSPWNYLFEISIEHPYVYPSLKKVINELNERDGNGNLICPKVFKEVNFNITFYINTINSSWTTLLTNFKEFQTFFIDNNYSIDDLNVKLTMLIQEYDFSGEQSTRLIELIGPSFIHHLKLASLDSAFYDQDLTCIKECTNLVSLDVILDLCCNLSTLGDLSTLTKLKTISFTCDNVDYYWLSNYLPKSVEQVQIFHSSFRTMNTRSFVVPAHIKLLVIESDDDETILNLKLLDFQKAHSLEKLVIYNRFNLNQTVQLYGITKLPSMLKVLAFANVEYRFFDDFSNPPLTASEFLVDCSVYDQLLGIYSNIDIRCDIHGQGVKFDDDCTELHRIDSNYMIHHKQQDVNQMFSNLRL